MANLADASPKELWAAARNGGDGCNRPGSYVTQRLLSNPDLVNEFFAAISTTNAYNDAAVWTLRAELEQYSSQTYVNGYELEPALRRLKNTAPGCDEIPSWVYLNCSFELADVTADIFNCSFRTGMVPVSWLTAVVTPVPTVSHPVSLSDFRPIFCYSNSFQNCRKANSETVATLFYSC